MIAVPEQSTPTYFNLVSERGWDPRDLWPGSYMEGSPPTAGEVVAERDAGLMVLTPEQVSARLSRITEEDLEKRVQAAIDDGDPSNAHALHERLRQVEGYAVGYNRVRACWRRLSSEDGPDRPDAVEGPTPEPGEAGAADRELVEVPAGAGPDVDSAVAGELGVVGDEQGETPTGD